MHGHERVQRILSKFGDIGDAVGIYVLSENGTIFNKTRSREPKQYNEYLNHTNMFKILRKGEYENIILEHFGELPRVKPVFHFKACLEQFEQIPTLEAQSALVK